jgi:soluble lytic murein transglycosylase-like protein
LEKSLRIFAILLLVVLSVLGCQDLSGISSSMPEQFRGVVADAGIKYSLAPSLIASVIHVESSWNPLAVSRTNHHGLMQIAPEVKGDWKDPAFNVDYGTSLLRYYIDRATVDIANEGSVHGTSSSTEVGLAYYNAGRMGARTSDKGWGYAAKVLQLQRDIYAKNIL